MTPALIKRTWDHLRGLLGLQSSTDVRHDDVRLELAELGVLGHSFSIRDELLPAVKRYLGLAELTLEPYPDRHRGVVMDKRLEDGVLADVSYNEKTNEAVIIVRESLEDRPWPAYELCVLHELSHLLGKHHLMYATLKLHESTIRESWTHPQTRQDRLEVEARKRAKLLLLAHSAPGAFERAGTDRVT